MDNMKNKAVRLIDELPTLHKDEVRSEWFYIDGYRVNSSLYEMATELRADRAFRKVKFIPAQMNSHTGANALYVYFPDEIYTRGAIGYGDVGIDESVELFYVNSKSISNQKVRWHRWQHHVSGSSNMKRAVKTAKQHLRAFNTSEVTDITCHDVASALRERVNAADQETTNKKIALRDLLDPKGALTHELRGMIQRGHAFSDSTLQDNIVSYLDAIDEEKSEVSRKIMITLAIVYPPRVEGMEQQIVTQAVGEPFKLSGNISNRAIVNALSRSGDVIYSESTLPEQLRSKLSALSILEKGTYVDGLGTRVSDRVYYLAEDCE
jgi:hypothetical protein